MKDDWQDDLEDDKDGWLSFIFWPIMFVLGLAIIFLFVTNPSF